MDDQGISAQSYGLIDFVNQWWTTLIDAID